MRTDHALVDRIESDVLWAHDLIKQLQVNLARLRLGLDKLKEEADDAIQKGF